MPGVTVVNGQFTTDVDFGLVFTGAPRYLEVRVRTQGSPNYTPLAPRTLIATTPYAIRSLTSGNAATLNGIAANQYVLTSDVRLTDARPPLPGSANYINNSNTPQSSSNFNISGNGTIGGLLSANVVNSTTGFNIAANRVLSIGPGSGTLIVGPFAGENNTGAFNSFFGTSAGRFNSTGLGNTFIGSNSGDLNTTGSFNVALGDSANFGGGLLTNAVAIGAKAFVTQSNSLVLGSINGVNLATADTNVGIGTTAPQFRLHIVGENLRVEGKTTQTFPRFSLNFTGGGADAKKWQNYATTNALRFSALSDSETAENIWLNAIRSGGVVTRVEFNTSDVYVAGKLFVGLTSSPDQLAVNGTISFAALGAAGSTQLCRNASSQIATCSSSLRYKSNIAGFTEGMSFIRQLRPISFDWKDGGLKDVGFGAEDIARIDPRFVTFNEKGEVEGVKYDRLSVAFVNAFREQQTEIETQRDAIRKQQEKIDQQNDLLKRQQAELEALKKLVCAQNQNAEICRANN